MVAPSLSVVRRPDPRLDVKRPAGAPVVTYSGEALLAAYRLHGHRAAAINPLDELPHGAGVAELDPRSYGFQLDDSVRLEVELGGASETLDLSTLIARLRASYCGSIALECAHVRSDEQRRWLYQRMETIPAAEDPEAMRLLECLVAVEAFEHRRQVAYAQYKQFNLEGSETFVPLLRYAIEEAVGDGAENVILAMPHRGRLNVMLNALDVPAGRMLSLFSPNPDVSLARQDLRDHAGLCSRIETDHGAVEIVLLHNPSHLESVIPVACGMARALQDRKASGCARRVLPVLVHGDGSFCGQGVVAETFNLAQTRGYGIGGTLHFILNNQVGSTVSHPRDQRSTMYCADLARAFDAPIVHVNADDPEAVMAAARVATEFRMKFGTDIVVDHVGYRRYGHWVGDDPMLTRPAMQRRIENHPGVVALYAANLARRGLAANDDIERLRAAAVAKLEDAHPRPDMEVATGPTRHDDMGVPDRIHTAVPIDQLRALIMRLATAPEGFAAHSSIEAMRANWRAIAEGDDRRLDWRLAENLAYASLLANGFNIRLTGLDIGRGSFCHRQHVWHDQDVEVDWREIHVPLRRIGDTQGSFSIFESPLSEEAVLGFEYGYSLRCGRDLVVWEGQFGDFVNNAQVIIDQFLATGESKWGYESGLVVLLPHGDDGLGPEHSCAFLGRFLALCAGGNMEVTVPSTPAQFYHVLRRQALRRERKPLVVMTPKPWLYGHEPSYSRLVELADGEFQPLLAEGEVMDSAAARRIVITGGKFFYELSKERSKAALPNLPILRAEQLYPFPTDALARQLSRYPQLEQVVWAQEEPKNHGAWYLVRDRLEAALPVGVNLTYAGRLPMAPASGCDVALHANEQRSLARTALGIPMD